MTDEALRRQLLARLQQLRNAGIDLIPMARDLPAATTSAISEPAAAAPAANAASALDIIDFAPEQSTLTFDERVQALAALAAEIKPCMRCAELCSTRTQTVFGDGKPGVELCFVGEAPGADEDASGVPFVGAAGQLLNKIIAASGFRREEVYICNIVKCRPPANRTPLANEAANCREYLERQLELVQPKFIVALGSCAATNLLQTTLSIAKMRGRFHDYKGIPVLVTYHPAYLLPHKRPDMKREVWNDMKMLLEKMGRAIPQKAT